MSSIQLPNGYSMRPITKSDFQNGAIETLETLTTVGPITRSSFDQVLDNWSANSGTYKNLVITDTEGKVVAIGSLIVELKLIHGCSKVGHIEDIAVLSNQQGKKLGLLMITELIELAKAAGCYKVILDCDVKNEGFYQKCGLSRAGLEMEYRF